MWLLGPITVPGLNLAKGPTTALSKIFTPSICEKAFIWTLFLITTSGPKKTFGSIITSLPIFVS